MMWLLSAFAAPPVEEIVVEEERVRQTDVEGSQATEVMLNKQSLALDLASAVQRVPGALVQRAGAQFAPSFLRLRAGESRQTEVYIGSLCLNPDGLAAVDLSEIPGDLFRSAIVYRGLAPSKLGSSSMAGVLALTPISTEQYGVRFAGGSFGSSKMSISASGEAFSVGVSTSHGAGGDPTYQDQGTAKPEDDRVVPRANSAGRSVSVFSSTNAGPISSVVLISQRQGGLGGTVNVPVQNASWQMRRAVAAVGGEHQGDSTRVAVSGFLQLRDDEVFDPDLQVGLGGDHRQTGLFVAGLRSTSELVFAKNLSATASLTTRREELMGAHSPPRRHVLSATMATSWLPQWGDLTGGLSVRVFEGLQPRLLPRLSATVQSSKVRFTGQGALGFRAPDPLERYGDQGTSFGNEDLRPESSVFASAGLQVQLKEVELQGAVFGRQVKDRITWAMGALGVRQAVNIEQATVAGAEAGAKLTFNPMTSGFSATVAHAVDGDGRRLPGIPQLEGDLFIGASKSGVEAVASVQAQTATPLDVANYSWQPGRATGSLSVTATHKTGVFVGFDVQNITNQISGAVRKDVLNSQPQSPTALVDLAGYALSGRWIWVRAGWRSNN